MTDDCGYRNVLVIRLKPTEGKNTIPECAWLKDAANSLRSCFVGVELQTEKCAGGSAALLLDNGLRGAAHHVLSLIMHNLHCYGLLCFVPSISRVLQCRVTSVAFYACTEVSTLTSCVSTVH
jgi:hypothetical protein